MFLDFKKFWGGLEPPPALPPATGLLEPRPNGVAGFRQGLECQLACTDLRWLAKWTRKETKVRRSLKSHPTVQPWRPNETKQDKMTTTWVNLRWVIRRLKNLLQLNYMRIWAYEILAITPKPWLNGNCRAACWWKFATCVFLQLPLAKGGPWTNSVNLPPLRWQISSTQSLSLIVLVRL